MCNPIAPLQQATITEFPALRLANVPDEEIPLPGKRAKEASVVPETRITGAAHCDPVPFLATSIKKPTLADCLFQCGATVWYRELHLVVPNAGGQRRVNLRLPIRIHASAPRANAKGRSKGASYMFAAAANPAHRSYTYQMWHPTDGLSTWNSLITLESVGGPPCDDDASNAYAAWLTTRQAGGPVGGRGHTKVEPDTESVLPLPPNKAPKRTSSAPAPAPTPTPTPTVITKALHTAVGDTLQDVLPPIIEAAIGTAFATAMNSRAQRSREAANKQLEAKTVEVTKLQTRLQTKEEELQIVAKRARDQEEELLQCKRRTTELLAENAALRTACEKADKTHDNLMAIMTSQLGAQHSPRKG